jgi:hypothetical protein
MVRRVPLALTTNHSPLFSKLERECFPSPRGRGCPDLVGTGEGQTLPLFFIGNKRFRSYLYEAPHDGSPETFSSKM